MNWCPLWSYHFQNYESLPAVSAGIAQIIRFPTVISGKKVRVLFSNENGKNPVRYRFGKIKYQKTEKAITWEGQPEILLNPGKSKMSDEITLPIEKGETLIIEVWPEGRLTGYAGLNSSRFFQVEFQNQAHQTADPADFSAVVSKPFNTHVYFGIRSVEVKTEEEPELATVFGDSLVHQGHWFQELYYSAWKKGETKIFLNEGISGNRVLRDANSDSSLNTIFGEAGIRRIEKDVFSRYQPKEVILAEGINDLVHAGNGCPKEELPDSMELIAGLKKLCETVERHGSIPILATISPFCGYDESWNEQKEQIRQEVNAWIRSRQKVMDIDAYVRNPEQQRYLDKTYDSGDHLHFNQAGGRQIAERWLGSK